jgi:hypothetical protein
VTGPAATAFAVTVPQDWFEVDLVPSTRDASIRSLVYQQTRQVPELRNMRSDIVRLVQEFAARASDAGAVYCACFVRPTEAGPVTGSVTVTVIDSPPGPADGTPAVDRLLGTLSGPDAPAATTVTVAALPHFGEVARTYGIEDVTLPDGHIVRSVVMQTFIPLDGGKLALVTGSSAVLWLEESLLELFDAVTSTFRLLDTAGHPI